MPEAAQEHGIAFGEAVRVWMRVAALSFGGPAGQIAVMHRMLVEEKRWIGERRFLHALNFCMLLPGPEAQQLAVYLGWLLHRTRGGVVAGVLFVLPGFFAILALSLLYVGLGRVPLVEGLFFGLRAAVLAIVLQAVARIGGRTLRNRPMIAIAAASFVAIFFFDVPFPLIVGAAAVVGYFAGRARRPAFAPGGGHAEQPGFADAASALGAETPGHARPDRLHSLRVGGTLLALWLGPVALLMAALGPDDVFARLGVFFSQMAVVTFGGAYAVLAYVAQAAVTTFGWLRPGEMLDGLAMAETTPGPLIQVVQFVGFLAAFRDPGGLQPYVAATLASVLVTWVTFAPSFLWILLGAPFSERLRGNPALGGALAAITAAVVGVILNLAIWFALHVVFTERKTISGFGMRFEAPLPASLDPAAAVLTALALGLVFRLRLSMPAVLALAAVAGAGWRLAAG
jgi:chromate transporter